MAVYVLFAHYNYRANWALSVLTVLPIIVAVAVVYRLQRSTSSSRALLVGAYAGTLVVTLVVYSMAMGLVEGLYKPATFSLRLLVSPDAKVGLRGLGIEFSAPRSDGSGGELSSPLEVVLENDKTYLLRLKDGTLVELSKDKVWGAQWETHSL